MNQVHYHWYDLCGMYVLGSLVLSPIIGSWLGRKRRRFNRKIIRNNYVEIGFTARKPVQGDALCQKQR